MLDSVSDAAASTCDDAPENVRLSNGLTPSDSPIADPELAAVVAAWSGLPEAVRARLVGLVEGATARGDRGTDAGTGARTK